MVFSIVSLVMGVVLSFRGDKIHGTSMIALGIACGAKADIADMKSKK